MSKPVTILEFSCAAPGMFRELLEFASDWASDHGYEICTLENKPNGVWRIVGVRSDTAVPPTQAGE